MIAMKRLETESSRRINYNSDIPTLEAYYKEQFELIKKGSADLATLELVMLGNALDFISFAKKSFGIILGSEEKYIILYDEIADALSRGIITDNIYDNIAKTAGAYLGFLIIANIGGKWIDTESGPALEVRGREVYVADFAERRLLSGSDLNAVEYYNAIKALKN